MNRILTLLFNLIELRLYKNRILKLEKERENIKYIIVDG
jgi:hypothetical protein